jgi:hypothetical protein
MSRKALLSAALLALGAACALPAWAGGPPPWAPAHGWRAKHHYTYYPEGEIYYAPESRLWFWLDGGSWRSGISLPLDFQGYVRTGGVSIELDADRPYVRHDYVVEHYGGRPPRAGRGGPDHDGPGGPPDRGGPPPGKGKGHGRDKHD